MARKQVGELDEALIDRMDRRADELGQTRVTFLTRAIEVHIEAADELLKRARARGGGVVTSAQAKAGVKPIERPSTTTQSRKGARLKR